MCVAVDVLAIMCEKLNTHYPEVFQPKLCPKTAKHMIELIMSWGTQHARDPGTGSGTSNRDEADKEPEEGKKFVSNPCANAMRAAWISKRQHLQKAAGDKQESEVSSIWLFLGLIHGGEGG